MIAREATVRQRLAKQCGVGEVVLQAALQLGQGIGHSLVPVRRNPPCADRFNEARPTTLFGTTRVLEHQVGRARQMNLALVREADDDLVAFLGHFEVFA